MKFTIAMIMLMLPVQYAMAGHHEQNAVEADPGHYSVEFENDVLRVVRIKYGPGEASTMHAHDANCVVFLSGGAMTMGLPDGTTEPAPANAPGEVNCSDAVVHLPTAGDTGTEVIMVELKGRAKIE